MKKVRVIIGVLAVVLAAFIIHIVLSSENALVTHPKGIIAQSELDLIVTNILLMLIIVIPTFILLFFLVWRYHHKKVNTEHDPEHSFGPFGELMLWIIPSVVIAVMIVVNWNATHELDPYQPLKSEVKPLTIQVVALDWKWLFIYPEQGIASVNFIQFPIHTPIRFELAADGSPMNSFWIPQLSGQIYSMTGMITPLHLMADELGEFAGRAAEINGEGFADMTFIAKSTSLDDFESWVKRVNDSDLKLTDKVYKELLKTSKNHPITFYSSIEKDIFNKIVMKYMDPSLWINSSMEN